MRRFGRTLGRVLLVGLLLVAGLFAPVAYVETMCRSDLAANPYSPILPAKAQRAEARTLLTYPEWHIVHAYEDYAQVIRSGAPHEFGYLRAMSGFWSSLCAVSRQAGALGGVDGATKQMVYTIGVSFTAELALKAAYEETLGRLAVWLRGDQRAPLDDLSARQAADYAAFLQQVPWYQWDFRRDAAQLQAARTDALRDRERVLALGLEYRAKAAYAGVIAGAVAGMPPDALRMRVVLRGVSPADLARVDGVTVIAPRAEGIEVELPRYRAFTHLAKTLADQGAEFVEIAGNDDILYSTLSNQPDQPGALHSVARQGFGDWRHLHLIKVADLAGVLRRDTGVEHIHDY